MTGNLSHKGGETLSARKLFVFSLVMICALILSAGAGFCSTEDITTSSQGYGAGFWYASVFGQATDANGNTMSLRSDLGLKNAAGLNADLNWQLGEKFGADLNFAWMKGEKKNYRNPNAFVFNNNFVPANSLVNSTMKLTSTTVCVRYSLVKTQDGQLDFGVAPKFINFESTVTTPGRTIFSQNKSILVPCLALQGKARMSERIYIDGVFHGMKYKDNQLLDFRADLVWNFQHPGWCATIGYRVYDLKAKLDNNQRGKVNWNGPLVTLRYEF